MTEQTTDKAHTEDLEDMGAELKRREMAFKFMSQTLAQHVETETKMKVVLDAALLIIDQLLNDLRLAGSTPSPGLILAKGRFDDAMKQLLGEKRSE